VVCLGDDGVATGSIQAQVEKSLASAPDVTVVGADALAKSWQSAASSTLSGSGLGARGAREDARRYRRATTTTKTGSPMRPTSSVRRKR